LSSVFAHENQSSEIPDVVDSRSRMSVSKRDVLPHRTTLPLGSQSKLRLLVLLIPVEDEYDVGCSSGIEVLWSIILGMSRRCHANRPSVTLLFVDAILLLSLLIASVVQVVDCFGIYVGFSTDCRLIVAKGRFASGFAACCDDKRKVWDAFLGEWVSSGLHSDGFPSPF